VSGIESCTPSPFPTEADVDAILAEFGGNAREATRALLHDISILAQDYEVAVSRGFVRGDVPRLETKRRA
jgi:hypothetical protein